MPPQRVQSLRSTAKNTRPTQGSRLAGELYVNFPDKQLGFIDSAKTPQDLIAVRFFSATTNYAVGDFVIQAGRGYRAKNPVTEGAFNAADWDTMPIAGEAEPPITPGTVAQYWRGDKSWQTLDKTAVGLSQVDNTNDASKPVSGPQQTALNLKANIASPTLTGTPAAPTAAPGTSTTQLATTAFVATSFATNATLNLYAPIASPAFTGNPTAPTPAPGDADTSIATTAFVTAATANFIPDAPSNANAYGRKQNAWVDVAEEAPADSITYGRKNGAWVASVGGAAIGDGAPTPPLINGQLWWESDTGNLYVYFQDGTSDQFVQVNAAQGAQESIYSTSADMWAGFATSGNRFIVNDKADGTGTNVFSVSEAGAVGIAGAMTCGAITSGAVNATGNITVTGAINSVTLGTTGTISAGSSIAATNNVTIASGSPALSFWPGAGSTQRGLIQSVNGGAFTINGNAADLNLVPATTCFIGPRTAAVAATARATISYLGVAAQYGLTMVAENAAGTSFPIAFVFPPSSAVGSISHTASATAYNTTSDARLKEFTGELSGEDAAEIIRADPARRFNWVLDGSPAVGWSAQDSYAVSPDLATPGDDLGADARTGDDGFWPWGMDQAKRTPYLWAALAMALDKIDALETRLATLEGGAR